MLAPLGRDAELACQVLIRAGFDCRSCCSMDEVGKQPANRYGAVLLAEEALAGDAVRSLGALLDAQPAWSDLPVAILTGRGNRSDRLVRETLADTLASRQGIVFLERPIRTATFVSVMRSAVLARRRQYELRDQLVARQKAEDHALMLTEEMKHRIKNSLGQVAAMASQTFRPSRPVDDSLNIFSGRLQAMAVAQDVLTHSAGDGASLQDLVNRALEPYRQDDAPDRIVVGGPEVWIGGRRSTSLTMAMHELATNAVKYGALSVEAGRVTIGWHVRPVAGSACLHLEWREQGGPAVTEPTRRGFGSRLVERALAMELGGKATILFKPDGVVCEITASLDEAV